MTQAAAEGHVDVQRETGVFTAIECCKLRAEIVLPKAV